MVHLIVLKYMNRIIIINEYSLLVNGIMVGRCKQETDTNISMRVIWSGILYVSFDDGEDVKLLDMTSLTKPFDIPLTFGCSLSGAGNPQRYYTGTIKDMNIKIYN